MSNYVFLLFVGQPRTLHLQSKRAPLMLPTVGAPKNGETKVCKNIDGNVSFETYPLALIPSLSFIQLFS